VLLIGICDGDTSVRIKIGEYIRRYMDETGITVQVLSYDNGDKLLHHYPYEMDLIFLEIPFTKLSGIEIAKRIREADPHVSIVFLTTILNHVLEAYEVRASNYLIKPLKYSRFLKEIDAARTRRGHNRFFIEVNDGGLYKIYTKSICYIETINRNTRIQTETDSIISYKRMKTQQEILYESYFVRVHTGYIVNLLFFDRMEASDIFLITGHRIPVSRHRKKDVINKIRDLYQGGIQ